MRRLSPVLKRIEGGMAKLRIFPADRMNVDYPWVLWALGWLAVFRAILWLAYEPVVPEAVLRLVGWKYIIGAVPFLACGVGLWRRRRWAAWGLTALAVLDLAVLALAPQSFFAYLVDSEVFAFSVVLSAVVLVSGGPVGNLLILAGLPSMLRNTSR
jgi:hypothetical protein